MTEITLKLNPMSKKPEREGIFLLYLDWYTKEDQKEDNLTDKQAAESFPPILHIALFENNEWHYSNEILSDSYEWENLKDSTDTPLGWTEITGA